MKNYTKMVLGAAGLVTLVSGTAAFADDAPAPAPAPGILGADFPVSGSVAIQSDYRFRGISQNRKYPSEQAALNIGAPDGFYAGLWTAKVDWTGVNQPSYELDEFVGKHTDVFGFDWNLEAYYYSYPDAEKLAKFVGKKASYLEIIDQISHSIGPVALTATYAYSPVFSLGGGDANYIEGTASIPVTDWLSLSGNVGHQWVQNAKYATPKATDYTHYDIGGTITYKTIAIDLRYVGTDMNKATCAYFMIDQTNKPCSGGFVGTLTYNISSFPW